MKTAKTDGRKLDINNYVVVKPHVM